MTTILELMRVDDTDRDLDWLHTALQAAVELELATIPPYLCAMWSVQDPNGTDPVRALIRSIAMEEMGHMATACNLLTAIGGSPEINTLAAVPQYPGPLPGGVHPGLTIPLSGLTKDLVWNVFMEIELPQSGSVLFAEGSAFPTIGAFYSAIARAYKALPSTAITGARQVSMGHGTGAAATINDVNDATAAIARIQEQGEGSTTSPVGDPGSGATGDDLAHYYQFAEIFYERRLVPNADGVFEFTGPALPFPQAPQLLPMAVVPAAGYPESADFDRAYTAVLNDLQQAWDTGDQPVNGQKPSSTAVFAMFSLETLAVTLMSTPRTDGPGNLGPDFKLGV